MNHLPGPDTQPHAPQAGQPLHNDVARRQAAQIAAAVDEVYVQKPATVRFDDPNVPSWKDGTQIGDTPAVTQPGRPPMSQRAVDLNTTILSSSVLAAVLGGSATAVMWASGKADPEVIAWVCGCAAAAPAFFALPVLALKGLMKSAKEVVQAAPPVIHQYYSGPITQTHNTINADTRGLIAVTRNELPPTR